MGVKLNYIPMVTNSLKLNPFTPRAARHVIRGNFNQSEPRILYLITIYLQNSD